MRAGGTERLTCCGDEPLKECGRRYAEGVRWLLHEAFCEDAQEAFFHAHEYFHSTVKEACETAERLGGRAWCAITRRTFFWKSGSGAILRREDSTFPADSMCRMIWK